MLLDVDALEARKTISDQYGIYHAYQSDDQVRSFLMFCCSTRKDAIRFGEAVAKALGVRLINKLPALSPREQEEEDRREQAGADTSANSDPSLYATYQIRHGSLGASRPTGEAGAPGTGKKRVMGVANRIKALIGEGKTDAEIIEACVPMYTEAGKTETYAKEFLKMYVKDIRGRKE